MLVIERPLIWMGSSFDDLKKFPVDARNEAGHQLNSIQNGFDPTVWKPFSEICSGVREIRI